MSHKLWGYRIAHFGNERWRGTQTIDCLGDKSSSHLELWRGMQVLVCTKNFRNSPGLAFHRIPKARRIPREYVRLLRNANLKLNSESTRICILLVFLEVKSPQVHPPPASHFDVLFPFNYTFCSAILSCFKPVETIHFACRHVCLHSHVPPNNPLNARAITLFWSKP